MNIHEFQAKEIFSRYGIPVNPGKLAKTPEEAAQAAQALSKPGASLFVVKAQVHAGARGKAGGIKLVKTPDEAKAAAQGMLHQKLITRQTGAQGKPIDQVLIEATTDLVREFYVSIVLDRSIALPCLIVSTAGGMDIEEVAVKQPEKIIKKYFSATEGLGEKDALEVAGRLQVEKTMEKQFAGVFQAMAKIFLDLDVSLIEINPLAILKTGELVAIDAKINFDDHALYRHPEVAALRDARQEDSREAEAKKFDLSYVGLDGNIGCIVNGAGLAMATMDIIKYAGGEPANFLDVGGGASKEKVAAAFKIILMDPNVKAILVNIFGGIMRCDIVAEGILAAVQELSVQKKDVHKIPIVVRLEGTKVEEGRALLSKSNLNLISASDFEDAAKKVVGAAS